MFLLFLAKLGVYTETFVSLIPVGPGCSSSINRRHVERIHVAKRWKESTFLRLSLRSGSLLCGDQRRCYETQISRCDCHTSTLLLPDGNSLSAYALALRCAPLVCWPRRWCFPAVLQVRALRRDDVPMLEQGLERVWHPLLIF